MAKAKTAKAVKAAKVPETVYISEADQYLFAQGTHYDIYKKLGAHQSVEDGKKGMSFAVWAPHAASVSVIGTFNSWNETANQMEKLGPGGIYKTFIPDVGLGELYKFLIITPDGRKLYKADPFANQGEVRPGTASVTTDITNFKWSDSKWIEERNAQDPEKAPVAIYECHIGSWMKHPDTEDGFYNYREFADRIVEYLKKLKYTHIELMGIAEHPFDGSWGYQVTGYYAPTRRYGSPEDFMYFVDYMHSQGISVILDWVPAHFPKDAHGLAQFDGQALYEHPDKRRGEHPHWGTLIFNYKKKEVENFLLANGLFWLKKFHVDGLRVDAVASMLYLDYGKNDGEWLPNEKGGNENFDAIHLLQHMNQVVEKEEPGTMIIAEESTAWAGVTSPAQMGGLGFLFKWNMGWMNDFLEYMHMDPLFRGPNHGRLTFSLQYAYSENFIQVLSHDEVVHGKGSMINKMPGELDAKFANLRTAYGFMYGHPGKKLLFMGQEFAQFREWSEARSLDWNLLDEERNHQMQDYVKALNKLYQEYDALYANDFDPIGFEWMSCENADMSVVTFVRRGSTAKKQLLFLCNFTPVTREDMLFGVPCPGTYKEILSSDEERFGGTGIVNPKVLTAKEEPCDGRNYSIRMTLPPLSVTIYEYDYRENK